MQRQIHEAIYQSALRLDPASILALCRTNKQYNRDLCDNEGFWTDKLSTDFGRDPFFIKANQKLIDNVPNRMRYQIFYNPKEQDVEDAIDAEVDEKDMNLSLFLTKRREDKLFEDAIERLSYLDREDLINPFVKEITGKDLDYETYIDKSEPENFSIEEFKLFKSIIFAIYRGRLATRRGDYDAIELTNKIDELGEKISDEENYFDEETYEIFNTYNDALMNKLRVAEKYSSTLSDVDFLNLLQGSEEVMSYTYAKKLSINVIKRLFDMYINNDEETQDLLEVLLEEYFRLLYYGEQGIEVIPIPFAKLLGVNYKKNKDLWDLIIRIDLRSHFIISTERVRIYLQSYEELLKTDINKKDLEKLLKNLKGDFLENYDRMAQNILGSASFYPAAKDNIEKLSIYVNKL